MAVFWGYPTGRVRKNDAKLTAACIREIALARDALELVPGLATGMAVGADIAAAEPAVIRAIVIGTKMPRGIDGAPAFPRQDDHRRW